jgi:hypothetical protein
MLLCQGVFLKGFQEHRKQMSVKLAVDLDIEYSCLGTVA